MKIVSSVLLLWLAGCGTIQDAKNEFRNEIVGFKSEWDRVILKKQPVEN